MPKLAIVIPAYKNNFFEEVLKSLSNQTCKDFTVYVGDDCSPSNFKDIVEKYKSIIDIVYHRFADNLGGLDLVGQWERCIGLTQREDWIWLFSDDDILESTCVEAFYRQINDKESVYDIYHFNVNVIDSNGNFVRCDKDYPEIISSEEFYRGKASAKLDCFVVEYIFSRYIYNKTGGFEKFNMAWGSDVATWIKMGASKGIKTIMGPRVLWRNSDFNITPNLNNSTVYKKLLTDVDFLCWINAFFNSPSIVSFNKYIFFRLFFHYSRITNGEQAKNVLYKAVDKKIISPVWCHIYIKIYPLIKAIKKIKQNLI